MEVTRTFDLLERYKLKFEKPVALALKTKRSWKSYSTEEYITSCHEVAWGLLEMGFQRGDSIITITNNRPEWNFLDHGMSMCGIIHVPVYTSLSPSDYAFIMQHSGAKLVIVSDKKIYDRIEEAKIKCKSSVPVYSIDELDNVANWTEIAITGRQHRKKWESKLEKIKSAIKPKEVSSLLYTSGTTGVPKGVLLTHENLVKNFIAAAAVFKLKPNEKYLSILPLCHVGGRMGNYQTQYSGTGIYYPESIGTFAPAMKEIGAHGFDAVPRVLEKVYDTIITRGAQLKGFKKQLFFWAVRLGKKYDVHGNNSWIYRQKHKIADRLIFQKWRDALGGKVRIVGCGGASLLTDLERLFWAAGVKIINMYGLTETSPIITINRTEPGNFRLGTVGMLIDGVEIKISGEGEILCRGHNVMAGYYKDEALTKEVIDNEGWLHTGDIGHLIDDRFLVITDRKKEIFKLSNGKYIAPQVLETSLKQIPIVDNIMVIGENKKHAAALIVPDFQSLGLWADQEELAFSNNEELICLPEVQKHFQTLINSMNKIFAEHERIFRFRLLAEAWTPEGGELSPTLKLKRKTIAEKHELLINQIYN